MDTYESTAAHIEALHARRERLTALIDQADQQLAHRLGCAVRSAQIGDDEVVAYYRRLRPTMTPGGLKRWCELTGIGRYHMTSSITQGSNVGSAGWEGTVTVDRVGRAVVSDPCPIKGRPVVYVLYDANLEPVYVGSTGHLRQRIHQHLKAGKPVAHWRAHLCRSRADAYAREKAMLQDVLPAMNRRAW